MQITKIEYSPEKKRSVTVSEAELSADGGIVGDFHFGPGDRQICIASEDTMQEIRKDLDGGLCFRKFHPNLTVSGFSSRGLKKASDTRPGTRLQCGSAVLEVTTFKRCFPEECELSGTGKCPLQRSVVCARVVTSGLARTGDPVTVEEQTEPTGGTNHED